MVAASNLRLQQSFAPIWPEMFLLTFYGIKSVLQFQFSQTFLKNANFAIPRIKFPDISLTLKNFFPWPFPDLWQPRFNSGCHAFSCHAPGQSCTLQTSISRAEPTHVAPPWHVRVLSRLPPPPQLLEQALQADQSLQKPAESKWTTEKSEQVVKT